MNLHRMSIRNGARRLRDAIRAPLSVRPRPLDERTLLGAFGVALSAAVLGLVGGGVGVWLAAAFVLVWLLLRPVYGYALGHVLALGASARALAVVELLFVELGLLAVLLGPLTRAERRSRGTVVRPTLGFVLVLFGVVVVGLALVDRLWVVAALLLLAGGGGLYGLHRYELVVLGLVADDDPGVDGPDPADDRDGTADGTPPNADGSDGGVST
jgi:hypothetical protein